MVLPPPPYGSPKLAKRPLGGLLPFFHGFAARLITKRLAGGLGSDVGAHGGDERTFVSLMEYLRLSAERRGGDLAERGGLEASAIYSVSLFLRRH